MKKNILMGVAGLLIGSIVGFYGANFINKNDTTLQNNPMQSSDASPHSAGQPAGMGSAQGGMGDVQATIDKANNEPENVEAQLKAGDMYFQIGRSEKALEFYERARKVKPDEFDVIVSLGNAYFDTQKFDEAEKMYLKALEKKEDPNVRTDLGLIFLQRPNPDIDRAIKEFETSLKNDPKHLPSIYNLSLAHHQKGNSAESQKYMTKLDELNPEGELSERLKKAIEEKSATR